MQGVQIGTIKRVAVSCEAVAAMAEISDGSNVIPLGSRVDVNQLGLAADPYVDITPPQDARQLVGQHGPHHRACGKEGSIVCHGGTVQGHQGGSFDYMMKFTLKTSDRDRVREVED
jgi:hypothetical protein